MHLEMRFSSNKCSEHQAMDLSLSLFKLFYISLHSKAPTKYRSALNMKMCWIIATMFTFWLDKLFCWHMQLFYRLFNSMCKILEAAKWKDKNLYLDIA